MKRNASAFSLFGGLTEASRWNLSNRMIESLLAIKMPFCQFMEPEPMQAIVERVEAEAIIAR
jgi:hypothetical protein